MADATISELAKVVGVAVEHPPHVRDLAGVPRRQVLIERVGAIEHRIHARDLARVPAA